MLKAQVKNGAKKAQVARTFNISRERLYQYLRD
jgi:DNA-binding phage protein